MPRFVSPNNLQVRHVEHFNFEKGWACDSEGPPRNFLVSQSGHPGNGFVLSFLITFFSTLFYFSQECFIFYPYFLSFFVPFSPYSFIFSNLFSKMLRSMSKTDS